jgi:hypothetical protein
MFFKGGFAMHGSRGVPGYNASHGCVRMFVDDAQWLNKDFADVGTQVIILPYPSTRQTQVSDDDDDDDDDIISNNEDFDPFDNQIADNQLGITNPIDEQVAASQDDKNQAELKKIEDSITHHA